MVRMLEREPFDKKGIADALIAIGPACEPEVKKLLTHHDRGVQTEAKRIISAVIILKNFLGAFYCIFLFL